MFLGNCSPYIESANVASAQSVGRVGQGCRGNGNEVHSHGNGGNGNGNELSFPWEQAKYWHNYDMITISTFVMKAAAAGIAIYT